MAYKTALFNEPMYLNTRISPVFHSTMYFNYLMPNECDGRDGDMFFDEVAKDHHKGMFRTNGGN